MRWDPVPELTILATANPDYSQVEGDEFQIDVNQRYAIYYPEKRPFFLEGQEWLDPGGGMLYTRSMEMPRHLHAAGVQHPAARVEPFLSF